MTDCTKQHRNWTFFEILPFDQGGTGRHKCAGCAYDKGIDDGYHRKEELSLKFDNLPESQAGTIRHKSTHAAYALGYLIGVIKSYNS